MKDIKELKYWVERAYTSFNAGNDLMEVEYLHDAVNRFYYACFYIVNAYLLSERLTPKTHSGSRHLFNERLIKTKKLTKEDASIYMELFEARQETDYDAFVYPEFEKIVEYSQRTEDFLEKIKAIIESRLGKII